VAVDTLTLLEAADVIVASDESGYGALAGPLVVGCVVAPKGWVPRATFTDSKKMTDAERRQAASILIADERIFWMTLWAQAPEVDAENVYHANIRLHTAAIEAGLVKAGIMFPGKTVASVVDGNLPIPGARSLPKADRLVLACSAASVIAKVAHDTWMVDKMDKEFPGFGFSRHVGYGTPEHLLALDSIGPCAIHRRSFSPVAERLRPVAQSITSLMDDLEG
jgi:ribonuclease HII